MIESNNEKKQLFYIIVLVLTLLCMIISATIAFFKFIASQKKDDTVLYTGTLEINYIDGVYIKNPILFPQKSVNYNTYNDVYRNSFSIASTGTLDQNIKVDLRIAKNDFEENALKYVLYNDKGNELNTGYVPESGEITLLNNVYLDSKETATYTLIIWLDDREYDQNFEMEHVITGSIGVNAVHVRY